MAPWQNCLLGALALHKYVKYPFTDDAVFNWELFKQDIIAGVFFLNIVSKMNRNRHPLPQQNKTDEYSRRIGLEGLGLADMLAMLNLNYGSKESIDFVLLMGKIKAFTELYASSLVAKEFGKAPAVESRENQEKFWYSPYIQNVICGLDKISEYFTTVSIYDMMGDMDNYGFANTAFNTWGPTGSISIVADCATHGIEPLYEITYKRITRRGGSYELLHGPLLHYCHTSNIDFRVLQDKYVTAHNLPWRRRLDMQEALQTYCDSSISSTVNLPEHSTVGDVQDIFTVAWYKGLKGITVFRDNCKKSIFSKIQKSPIPTPEPPSMPGFELVDNLLVERQLLDLETAERHKIRWRKGKLYCTVSLDENDTPLEIFVKLPREAGFNREGIFESERWQDNSAQWDGLCRLISKLLRYNVPLKDVISQLDKSSYAMTDSCGVLARVLRQYIVNDTLMTEDGDEEEVGDKCPECGKYTLFREAGCRCCRSCPFTSCS